MQYRWWAFVGHKCLLYRDTAAESSAAEPDVTERRTKTFYTCFRYLTVSSWYDSPAYFRWRINSLKAASCSPSPRLANVLVSISRPTSASLLTNNLLFIYTYCYYHSGDNHIVCCLCSLIRKVPIRYAQR